MTQEQMNGCIKLLKAYFLSHDSTKILFRGVLQLSDVDNPERPSENDLKLISVGNW